MHQQKRLFCYLHSCFGRMSGTALVAALFTVSVIFTILSPTATRAAELVMFESEGCYWCEAWDQEVGVIYTKTGESKVLPLRRVDLDEELPVDLADVPSLYYTPTFVIMDKGKETARITGYPGEDFFWQLLDEIIEGMEAKRAEGG